MSGAPHPEFSRLVQADHLGKGETVREIEATEAEAAALARRYGVLDVGALRATVRLTPMRRGDVAVEGDFEATVTQRCVVTLVPVDSRVSGSFSLIFSHNAADSDEARVEIFEADDPEPAEPIVDGQFDIGEAVAEQVALEIDPFPRAPGAEFTPVEPEAGEEEGSAGRANPFAKLAILKDKLERGD